MVFPPGSSRFARSTSTWIHWWSPVASANLSIISWVTVSHSDGPSSLPRCVKTSLGLSMVSIVASSVSAVQVDQFLEGGHLVAASGRRHDDQRIHPRRVPRLDALADLGRAAV